MKLGFGGRKGSQDLPLEGIAELKAEVRLLRAILLDVLLAQATGAEFSVETDEVRAVLGLPEDADQSAITQRLAQERARVVAQRPCPGCGGMVNQREGVEEVDCHWCGETVQM
jgi:hypothetical protein